MRETKFTVGPWRTDTNSNGLRTIVVRADGQRIASAFFRGEVDGWAAVAEANARLIAAAPALFEALAMLLPYFEGEHAHDHPDAVRARSALLLASEGGKNE